MHQLRETYWLAAIWVLAYIKSCPRKGCTGNMGMYAFLDIRIQDMLVTEETESLQLGIAPLLEKIWWLEEAKKQDVSRSSVEAEYRAMAHTTCEIVWLKNLLIELSFRQPGLIHIHCDNQSAIYIAQNHVFHERTKHIEINCLFVRDAWTKKVVTFQFTSFSKQLIDLFTRAVSPQMFFNLCNKLRMLDLYAPAWERVLRLVISIGLLGRYPYTHLIFYIYLVPSLMLINQFLSRVSISLQSPTPNFSI